MISSFGIAFISSVKTSQMFQTPKWEHIGSIMISESYVIPFFKESNEEKKKITFSLSGILKSGLTFDGDHILK